MAPKFSHPSNRPHLVHSTVCATWVDHRCEVHENGESTSFEKVQETSTGRTGVERGSNEGRTRITRPRQKGRIFPLELEVRVWAVDFVLLYCVLKDPSLGELLRF